MTVITEEDLRRKWQAGQKQEIVLPDNARLTPSAQDFIKHWKPKITIQDKPSPTGEAGKKISTDPPHPSEWNKPASFSVHLEGHSPSCSVCGSRLEEKPGHMTQVDADNYAPKTDPCLLFRGKMDTLHALVLLAGSMAARCQLNRLTEDLESLAAYCREITSAEYNNRRVAPLQIRDLSEDQIHGMTHQPEKSLGVSHLLPHCSDLEILLQLNHLRCKVRETELTAVGIFSTSLSYPGRPDLIQALNRLSSAVYFLELQLAAEISVCPAAEERGEGV